MSDLGDDRSGETPGTGDDRLGPAAPAGPRRRRWLPVAVAALITAVVAGGLVAVKLAGGSSGATAGGQSASPSASSRSSALSPTAAPGETDVVRDGTVLQASGRVVKVPGKAARFCAPVPEPAIAWGEGHEPAPAWCPVGIDVTGVDLSRLQMLRTKDGATEGYAFLRGTYQSGVLHVTLQLAQRSSPSDQPLDVDPTDCPRRPGGWQHVPSGSNPSNGLQELVAKFASAHPGEVVSQAVARPNANALYLVLTVQHVALADKELPVRPGYLCVLPARWTPAQIHAAEQPWEAAMPQPPEGVSADSASGVQGVWDVGESVDQQGQTSVGVQLVLVTPQARQLADTAPAGLLHLQPWLLPVSATAPLPPPMVTDDPRPLSSAALASFVAASAAAASSLAASQAAAAS